MEEELDKTRSKMKSIAELKIEVVKIWNRIPKNLLKKVVSRFKTLLEKVLINKGHKESKGCRRDQKPNIKLSDYIKSSKEAPVQKGKSFKNKYFSEYPDIIERIAYSEKTLLTIKGIYKKFINKEVTFLNKIKKHLNIYQNKNNSSKRTFHKINEIMKFVKESNKFINKIIECKTTLQQKIDSMEDNEFWNLFPKQLKENFITTESLNCKEKLIENIIIINNENSKQIWDIVNEIKVNDEFDLKDKDIKAFYDLMSSLFNKSESETVISILNKTDAETYNDNDHSEDNELEAILLNMKRKRENPVTNNIVNNLNQVIAEKDMINYNDNDQSEDNEFMDHLLNKKRKRENPVTNNSILPEAFLNVPYQSNIDIQATTPEDYVMCLLSQLEKFCTKQQLWERSQIQNYNIIKSKPHLEEIVENLRLQRKVIISAEFVLINEDLLL